MPALFIPESKENECGSVGPRAMRHVRVSCVSALRLFHNIDGGGALSDLPLQDDSVGATVCCVTKHVTALQKREGFLAIPIRSRLATLSARLARA